MFWRFSLFLLVVSLIFVGCQSSEITSAKVYIQEKNWQKAYEQCALATQKEPNNPQAWLLLAQICTEMESAVCVVRATDRAVYLDPKTQQDAARIRSNAWQKFFNKGVLAGRKGAYEEAANWTLVAYAVDSTKAEAPLQLSFFYRKLGDNVKAIRFYRRAMELQPENEAIYIDLAATYINNKQSDEAVKVLKEIISKKPDVKEAYRIMGIAFTNLRQLDSAIYSYNEYLRLEPVSVGVLLEYGALLYETDKKDSASKVFEKVLEIDPQNVQAKYNLAVAYSDLERNNEAKALLEDVVKIEPNNYRAWGRLAIVHQKLGNVKYANAFYQFAEGLSVEEDGDIEGALKYFEKSVEYEPNFKDGWKKLVEIYEKLNISDKAERAKKKFQELEKK